MRGVGEPGKKHYVWEEAVLPRMSHDKTPKVSARRL